MAEQGKERDVFIAQGAVVDGDVTIGSGSGIWFNAVVRGDTERIRIGSRTNIQDLCILHADPGFPLLVGDNVTVGHGCILHGCTIGNNCLIGMGSVILNGAVLEDNVVLGAGSLVTQGKTIPAGTMAFGRPAKPVRALTQEECAGIGDSADEYVHLAAVRLEEMA